MGRFVITGGSPLTGRVKVSGAKNEALKVIPFSLLVNGEFTINNVPDIADIRKQLEIFEDLGGSYKFSSGSLVIDGSTITKSTLKNGLATKLRASIVYLGPLLARFSRVTIPFPGGCAIGLRPIDSHLQAFQDLGAEVECKNETYEIKFSDFRNKNITLSEQSVTATENVLLFLSSFEGDFTVKNCAIEPEIIALSEVMNKAGARVKLVGEREFHIHGSKSLTLNEVEIIPDRIEAFSYLVGMIATGGSGTIESFPAEYMQEPLEISARSGAKFEKSGSDLVVSKNGELKPFEISTAPYPGFPTDMQSPMSLIAAVARGTSTIKETMFENRLSYINELNKMGLNGRLVDEHTAVIDGPVTLKGSNIISQDLRSGITLVLAALLAQGESSIENAEIIDRGYENITGKLLGLNAGIKRND